jgi:uncharacterized Zn finger protein
LLKQKKEIPLIPDSDKRLRLIKQGKTAWPQESDDDWDDEPDNDQDDDNNVNPGKKTSVADFLKGKSRDELAAIITEFADNHPEVKSALSFKSKMSSPSVSTLVKTIGKEIDKASNEPGWQDYWQHNGFTPDYSRVISGLEKLFDSGHYDEIVELGKKLFSMGMDQAGQSDDDGETICEIADALAIVYRALKQCSIPDVDKMEQAIDWELADGYGLTNNLEKFWKKKFCKKDWNTIADRLLTRIEELRPESKNLKFSWDYARDNLTDWIIKTLDSAGRSDEKLNLCIQEAPITQSYERLVKMLLESGKNAEAEKWIRKGIAATHDELPGIASSLRKHLLEIHDGKRDWSFSAAIKADEFFTHPSINYYKELKKACDKAKTWAIVRSSVILFLNTGKRPKAGSPDWPLPDSGIAPRARSSYLKPPFTIELIEIALYEKDIDEALRLYCNGNERKRKDHSSWKFDWRDSISEQIAQAAKEKYPDFSIDIWKHIADHHIKLTNSKEYTIAMTYLNRIQKVMKKNGQEKAWGEYIATIKQKNIRKIRLVEMLGSLTGKRIIDE